MVSLQFYTKNFILLFDNLLVSIKKHSELIKLSDFSYRIIYKKKLFIKSSPKLYTPLVM